MVVAFDQLAELVSGFLEALEVVEGEELLLERAYEALRDTVGTSGMGFGKNLSYRVGR